MTRTSLGPGAAKRKLSLLASLRALAVLGTLLVLPQAAQANFTFTTVHTFAGGAGGSQPLAGLEWAQMTPGLLWGTTCAGGSGFGTIYSFQISNWANFSSAYSFAGAPADGDCPAADLFHWGGKLYGTAMSGGSSGDGTVFRIRATTSNYLQLHSFAGVPSEGAQPQAQLAKYQGLLWGVTLRGGTNSNGLGSMFTLDPSGSPYNQVFSWPINSGDALPHGLTRKLGYFYGSIDKGGGCGGVYKIQAGSPYAYTSAYYFNGATEGCHPDNKLRRLGSDFYGTLRDGGVWGCGSLFKMDSSLVVTIIYSFQCAPDGDQPSGDLAYANGMFYGTTEAGGNITSGCPTGCGTVFQIDPVLMTEAGLYSFCTQANCADGAVPKSGVRELPANSGIMYGTTSTGGNASNGDGTVFEVF